MGGRSLKTRSRSVGAVELVALEGDLTIGRGDGALREVVYDAIARGRLDLILDLAGVGKIDDVGLSELVNSHTTMSSRGGRLKLLHLPQTVQDMLTVTQLYTVFDVYEDEQDAISSF